MGEWENHANGKEEKAWQKQREEFWISVSVTWFITSQTDELICVHLITDMPHQSAEACDAQAAAPAAAAIATTANALIAALESALSVLAAAPAPSSPVDALVILLLMRLLLCLEYIRPQVCTIPATISFSLWQVLKSLPTLWDSCLFSVACQYCNRY